MADTPRSVGIYDPFATTGPTSASPVVINAFDKGLRVDVDDNGPALQAIIDSLDSQGADIRIPDDPSDDPNFALRFKQPIWIKKNFVRIGGTSMLGPALDFDLSAYAGPLPKNYFNIGDVLNAPAAGVTFQGNALFNMRLSGLGAVSGVLAQRATVMDLLNLTVTGSGLTYGIRQIASDSRFVIAGCTVGNAGTAYMPQIALSVENGGNQTNVSNNILLAKESCFDVINCVGTWCDGNIVGTATGLPQRYGIRIRNDIPTPAWCTWTLAGIGAVCAFSRNWFEHNDAAGETIYGYYVGYGTPPIGSYPVVGVTIDGFLHLSGLNATQRPVWIDHADQTLIRGGFTWDATIEQLVAVTANAIRTEIDIARTSSYDQNPPTSGSLIVDSGVKTSMPGRFRPWPFDGAEYFANVGFWTVTALNVAQSKYEAHRNRMTFAFYLVGSSCAGGPTVLNIKIPGGWKATADVRVPASVQGPAGPLECYATTTNNSQYIVIQRADGSAFPDSGLLGVQFVLPFPVDD